MQTAWTSLVVNGSSCLTSLHTWITEAPPWITAIIVKRNNSEMPLPRIRNSSCSLSCRTSPCFSAVAQTLFFNLLVTFGLFNAWRGFLTQCSFSSSFHHISVSPEDPKPSTLWFFKSSVGVLAPLLCCQLTPSPPSMPRQQRVQANSHSWNG